MNRGTLRVRPGLRVLQAIYQDPVNYPPTLNALRCLAAAGAEVLCIGFDRDLGKHLPLPTGARIQYLNARSPGSAKNTLDHLGSALLFYRAVQRAISTFRADLVIGYDHWGALALLPLPGRARELRMVHLHDILDDDAVPVLSTEGLVWALVKRQLSSFPVVGVPAEERAQYLRERLRRVPRLTVVENAPPLTSPSRNALLRTRLGISAEEPLAVVVGQMTLGAETVRALAQTRARWHLAVIGCRNPGWINDMEREARQHRLTDRLHLVPYTDYDTVRRWLPGCDLGLCFYARSTNPNWNHMGSSSVKIQEYMAAGLPSLVGMRDSMGGFASRTGGMELIETDSADAIRAGLDKLEPHSPRWRALSAAALAAHQSTHNCEAQWAALLGSLGLDR